MSTSSVNHGSSLQEHFHNLSIEESTNKEPSLEPTQECKRCAILLRRMKEAAETAQEQFDFNVRETRFSTSKSTLLKFPFTYFSAMISSGLMKLNVQGEYFIDRDPKYFGLILNYLGDPEHVNLFDDVDDVRALKTELDYYLIPCKMPGNWNEPISPKLKVENNTITKIKGYDAYDATALTTEQVTHLVKFRLVINEAQDIMLGLAPKSSFSTRGENYHRCG